MNRALWSRVAAKMDLMQVTRDAGEGNKIGAIVMGGLLEAWTNEKSIKRYLSGGI